MGQPQTTITQTGWRLVGQAAAMLSPTALLEPEPPPDDEQIVFAAQFRVKPRIGDPIDAALTAIGRILADARTGDGVVGRKSHFSDPPSKFHGLRWDTWNEPDRWIGELLWKRVHPAIAGVALTDHLVLDRRHADISATVRTWTPHGVAAVRGAVGAGQSRSPLMESIASALRLGFDGRIAEPRVLTDDDIEAFVRDVLLDEHRAWPVAVLAPTDAGDYHVDAATLSNELLGLAHVYVIDRHPATFRLSDALGDRRLSCYWGALRVYQPGFSCADDGRAHPLLVGDRVLDPVERSGLAGALALANRERVKPVDTPWHLRQQSEARSAVKVAPADVSAASQPAPVARVSEPAAQVYAAPNAFDRVLTEIVGGIRSLQEVNARLVDEVVRLRAAAAVRASSVTGVERRLSKMEHLLDELLHPRPPAETQPEPPLAAVEAADTTPDITLESIVQQASAVSGDALLILDSAVESAADSPYEDVDRVALILDTMAHIARRRQEGALGMSLRETFRDYGIEYRGSISRNTPARMLDQYRATLPTGVEVTCDEHVALGTSYDPRHCLRIYFSSRVPGEPRFVISHVGRHFDVSTTT